MFKFFKKKKEVKRYDFVAKLFLKDSLNESYIKIQGYYPDASDMAEDLNSLMYSKTFFANKPNGDAVVVRTEDIKNILILGKPLEEEDSNE